MLERLGVLVNGFLFFCLRIVSIEMTFEELRARRYSVDAQRLVPPVPMDPEHAEFLFAEQQDASEHTHENVKHLLLLISALATLVLTFAKSPTPQWLFVIGVTGLVIAGTLAIVELAVRAASVPVPANTQIPFYRHAWAGDVMGATATNDRFHAFRVDVYRGALRWFIFALVCLSITAAVGACQPQKHQTKAVIQVPAKADSLGSAALDSTAARSGFGRAQWYRLPELATAAVVCISPAVAWLTFLGGWRDKREERRRQKLDQLELLHAELELIGSWARTQYRQESHDPAWYSPFWSVLAFPWSYIERFNRLVTKGEFPGELAAAIAKLEAAARRFHQILAEQQEFLGRADPTMKDRIGLARAMETSRTQNAPLTDVEIGNLPSLSEEDRSWLRELYRRNRETHTSGIGREGDEDGLHEAWQTAMAKVQSARGTLRGRPQEPMSFRIGHLLALTFVVVGLFFLADFGMSVARNVAHATTARQSKRNDASTADTTVSESVPLRSIETGTRIRASLGVLSRRVTRPVAG